MHLLELQATPLRFPVNITSSSLFLLLGVWFDSSPQHHNATTINDHYPIIYHVFPYRKVVRKLENHRAVRRLSKFALM